MFSEDCPEVLTNPNGPCAGGNPQFSVPMTPDLARVFALPTREWSDEQMRACAAYLTDQLRLSTVCDRCGQAREHTPWDQPGGCWYTDPEHPERAKITPPLSLRGIQAVVLWEYMTGARDGGYGVYMQIPVGGGKTLIFFLAALMIAAKRPLLFVPANLLKDCLEAFGLYSKYWRAPYPVPHVESIQLLTTIGGADMLKMRQPDFLGIDECDKARDLTRSAAKRIGEYIDQVRGACPPLMGSGTNKRKSLRDDNHFMVWCLRERAPAFLTDETLSDCCSALDEDSKVGAARLHPGALLELADRMGVPHSEPGAPSIGMLRRAREGYRLRVSRTPGIVIHDVPECTQPLTIRFLLAPDDPVIEQAFYNFRSTNHTPGAPEYPWAGDPVLMPDALSRYRHAKELGKGFWYYWDPQPPWWWKAGRKAWHQFVADQIYSSRNCPHKCNHGPHGGPCMRKRLDTELQVANAFPDEETLLEWRRVKSQVVPEIGAPFEPNSVPGWISNSVVQAAARFAHTEWIQQNDTGVIWVKESAVALRLAQCTGFSYYGEKGERIDANGKGQRGDTIAQAVLRAAHSGQKPPVVILSTDSNFRGRNLQAYANTLSVGWEPAGTRVEQRLGRHHRSGQTRPVTETVLVTCGEDLDAFQNTLSEARFVKSQGLTQKILTARIDRSGLRAYPHGSRWARKEQS